MSTPRRQQDGEQESEKGVDDDPQDLAPNKRGAEELERRRQSELAGQKHAHEEAHRESGTDERNRAASHEKLAREPSNADRAKENEQQAEAEGRELPG
jgi:hypothetical protein